jgi:tetratricopeptide (TPR) repeat protein
VITALSPRGGPFNWGQITWHELAHVFHLQLSKNRVPRWFTEGLAEYETALERPEWTREQGPDLFELRRAGRVPRIEAMNRAFTRAEQLSDMATAYYASSRLVAMLGERYGTRRLGRMLAAWGEGRSTKEVFEQALGVEPSAEDARFGALMSAELARYEKQFVPLARVGTVDGARAAVFSEPASAPKRAALALALLRAGRAEQASGEVARALALDEKNPDARFLAARIALASGAPAEAVRSLRRMLADGQDGYATQMLLAEAAGATEDVATQLAALEAARGFDETQAAPLYRLLRLAEARADADGALALLERLARLSEHDATVYRELVTRLVARGEYDKAVAYGEAAIYVDITGFATHRAFAEALLQTGKKRRAAFELESALLCEAEPALLEEARALRKTLGS